MVGGLSGPFLSPAFHSIQEGWHTRNSPIQGTDSSGIMAVLTQPIYLTESGPEEAQVAEASVERGAVRELASLPSELGKDNS